MKIQELSVSSLSALESELRARLVQLHDDVNSTAFLETAADLSQVQQALKAKQTGPVELQVPAGPPPKSTLSDFAVFQPRKKKAPSENDPSEPKRNRHDWHELVRTALSRELALDTPKAVNTVSFAKTYGIPYARLKDALPAIAASGEITRSTNGVRGVQVITRLSRPLPRGSVGKVKLRGDMMKTAKAAILERLAHHERREINLEEIRAAVLPNASASTFRNSLNELVSEGTVLREEQISTGKSFYTLQPRK